jgi:hypothetical protein
MPYIDYEELLLQGRAGDAFDGATAKDDISLINASPQAAQVATVTITAQNSTLYTVTINGVAVTYTSDASGTQAEISAGLQAAIQAESSISGLVIASGTTTLVITSRKAGLAFTISVGANLSAAATTASAAAAALPFGRAVIRDASNVQGCQLIAASAFTASSIEFTPTVTNSTLYQINLYVDGEIYVINYTSDGSATAQEIVEGLKAAADALTIPNAVTSEDDSVFLVESANGSSISANATANLALVVVSGDALADLFTGVALRQDTEDPSLTGGVDGYAPNANCSIRRQGRVRVSTEASCSPGDKVYVRVAASGANTTIGIFSNVAGAGAVLLPGASWYKNESASLAILQL